MIIARKNSSRVLASPRRSGIHGINRYPDLPGESHPTGKHCFTNRLTCNAGAGVRASARPKAV